VAAINPYLHFNGNTEEAFSFYASMFGGAPEIIRYKDAPADNKMDGTDDNKVMHASLRIGANTMLLASDLPSAYGTATAGNNFFISFSTGTNDEAEKVFAALSEGGQITMPIEKTFWASRFGMCKDKFGIQWMVGTESK
jgi:PhnB protein